MATPIIFAIEYVILNSDGRVIKEGEINVKNKTTKFEAQCSLEVFLKKKHPDFKSMIIKKCNEKSDILNMFDEIFGKNNKSNPFGGSNPFKF